MSSNVQRQAVPLSRSEKGITEIFSHSIRERHAALDSGVSVIAEYVGKSLRLILTEALNAAYMKRG